MQAQQFLLLPLAGLDCWLAWWVGCCDDLATTTLAAGLPAACDDLAAWTAGLLGGPGCDDLAATTLAVGLPAACDDLTACLLALLAGLLACLAGGLL